MPEAIEVADMEPSEAVALFRRGAKLQEEGQEIRTEVAQIVKELEHLALAITLAGSNISVTPRLSSDIRRYLPEYRQRRKELLRQRPQQHIHRYGENVLSTWEASLYAIAHQHPAASRLLSVLAFMNFDDIFMDLFDRNAIHVMERPETLSLSAQTWRSYIFPETDGNSYELESAFQTLQMYSLVQWRSDQRSYSMHKLVHIWGQDRLEATSQEQLSSLTLELLADATADYQSDASYRLRLVPHMMVSFGIYSQTHDSMGETTGNRLTTIRRIGDFLYTIGRWTEAYNTHVFYFQGMRKLLGVEHPDTLTSMNNLASVLDRQGKYKEAKEMHRQELALCEMVLGKERPSTLTSMNNLALVLNRQGKYEEAEEMHRQTLALCETVLGKEHPSTLRSMNNLVNVLGHRASHHVMPNAKHSKKGSPFRSLKHIALGWIVFLGKVRDGV